MPTLVVRARNVSPWPSDFHLQGLERRTEVESAEPGIVVIDLKDAETASWFEVVNIRAEGIPPGEEVTQTSEIDYDVRPLVWGVPHEALRGRFELLELRWGEHELLRAPGVV